MITEGGHTKTKLNNMEYHEPQPNEQRAEHTARTIEAIEILQDQFLEIQRLKLIIEDLRNRLSTASN